jgi:hypothetical protein
MELFLRLRVRPLDYYFLGASSSKRIFDILLPPTGRDNFARAGAIWIVFTILALRR